MEKGRRFVSVDDLDVEVLVEKTSTLADYFKGGPGSGNFGYTGIPGQVGGSAGGGGSWEIWRRFLRGRQ